MTDDTQPAPDGPETIAAATTTPDAAPINGAAPPPRLQVDTSDMKSSYANFCNANFTREEVVLNFGMNHDWDRNQGTGQGGANAKLAHRIVLSPFAARRVADMMAQLMRDYEARHGKLT